MQSEMVKDPVVRKAVSGILLRSEKQDDILKLVGTFVDVGVLPQLANKNHQILFGRRGTGKTHVFRVLTKALENDDCAVVYIDARTLGSTAQFSDTDQPLGARCLALFRDILGEVYAELMERVVRLEGDRGDGALNALAELERAITQPERVERETALERRESLRFARVRETALSADFSGAGVDLSSHNETSSASEETRTVAIDVRDKVIFPALYHRLMEVLEIANLHLFVLVDEWSSLPRVLQPQLAEFFKRGLLPAPRCTLKIAALEYRSSFSEGAPDSGFIGFELGSDISANLDLDEYYVFDRNPDQSSDSYSDMLLRHLQSEVPPEYLEKTYAVFSGADLASRLFTERDTFRELARACEGVIRDLINIFSRAFFDSQKRGRGSIDRKSVVEAARLWFEQDKSKTLSEDLHRILARIVGEVIGKRQARSFLLPRHLEQHPTIQKLFDLRVVHQMQKGYADKDNPGVRYNIYTLDYGTYVDLLSTAGAPRGLEAPEVIVDGDFVVPFDDKRSIRRIVLDEAVLTP